MGLRHPEGTITDTTNVSNYAEIMCLGRMRLFIRGKMDATKTTAVLKSVRHAVHVMCGCILIRNYIIYQPGDVF